MLVTSKPPKRPLREPSAHMNTTLTVVEQGSTWTVVAATDDRSGIVHIRPTFQSAFDLAYATLYDAQSPPYGPGRPPYLISVFVHTNDPYATTKQTPIHLSTTAWNYLQQQCSQYGYEGRGRHHGVTRYLAALLKANPPTAAPPPGYTLTTNPSTPQPIIPNLLNWMDTRHPDLRIHDYGRLRLPPPFGPRFPIWSATYIGQPANRSQRNLNHAVFTTQCGPTLLQLSNHFLIAPITGHATPRSRATAALEAIGYQYLTPRNPPILNPHPVNTNLQKTYYKTKRRYATELVY